MADHKMINKPKKVTSMFCGWCEQILKYLKHWTWLLLVNKILIIC